MKKWGKQNPREPIISRNGTNNVIYIDMLSASHVHSGCNILFLCVGLQLRCVVRVKVSHTGLKATFFADSCLRCLLPAVADTSEIKMRTQTLISFLGNI